MGVPPVNSVFGIPPFHPEKGRSLHGVYGPFRFLPKSGYTFPLASHAILRNPIEPERDERSLSTISASAGWPNASLFRRKNETSLLQAASC
jgi:hypothetical protein